MKKIERILAFAMVLAMAFTAVGCRKSATSDGSDYSAYGSDYTDASDGGDTAGDAQGSDNTLSDANQNTQSNSSGGSTAGNQVKLDFGGETVTMILEWQPSDKKGIDASRDRELDRIAEINKKYNVNLVMKKGASNYNEGIVSSIAAGSPIGNIIRVSSNGTYDLIRAGLCANLNDAIGQSGIDIKSSVYNYNEMKAYNVNNNQYAITCIVPQESGSGNLWYYNKSVLKELGYSENYITELCRQGKWNWSAVTTLAQQAVKTNSNGSISRYGIGYNYAYVMAQNMIIANNGMIGSVAKDGTPQCNFRSESVKQALEQLHSWATERQGVLCTDETDAAVSKFGKGEIFLFSGGDAKSFYNTGVQFGVVYSPKGTSADSYIMTGTGGGATYIVPVTYQKQAAKYLVLLNELYAPYSDVSREDIVKADMINYFGDSDSWKFFRDAMFDTSLKRVNDPFNTFNIQWKDPAFSTVCQSLVKGSLTAGTLIEKYNDRYQAILDDLFDGYSLTGLK